MIKIIKIKMYMLKIDIRVQYWRNIIWLTFNYETNMWEILVTKQKEENFLNMTLESFNFFSLKIKEI